MNEEKLAGWIISYCRHDFTPSGHAEWKAWMELSGENARLFHDAVGQYRRARRLAAWDRLDTRAAWQRVTGRLVPRRRRRWRVAMAAAGMALALVAGYWLLPRGGDAPPLLWSDIQPGETRAILRLPGGEEIHVGKGIALPDTVPGVRGLADTTGITYRDAPRESGAGACHTLIVPRRGEYFLVLEDGSRVWLNADSELRYPVAFTGDRREVFLSGEAYFNVAPDAARPFIVESRDNRVEVLGTRFNIVAYRDEESVVTTLVEGIVKVSSRGRERVLTPGTRAVATAGGLTVSPANVAMATGWIARVFDFAEMPLESITRQLQRWYDVAFVYRDPALRQIPFTGTVGRDQPLHELLEVIEQLADIKFTLNDDKIEVTRK